MGINRPLHTLRRLSEWRIDENRRVLAEIDEKLAALAEKSDALEAQAKREQTAAADDPLLAYQVYPAYLQRCQELRTAIARGRAVADAAAAEVFDRLHDEFCALQALELLVRRRERQQISERDRQEQKTLDECGLRQAALREDHHQTTTPPLSDR